MKIDADGVERNYKKITGLAEEQKLNQEKMDKIIKELQERT